MLFIRDNDVDKIIVESYEKYISLDKESQDCITARNMLLGLNCNVCINLVGTYIDEVQGIKQILLDCGCSSNYIFDFIVIGDKKCVKGEDWGEIMKLDDIFKKDEIYSFKFKNLGVYNESNLIFYSIPFVN